MGSSHMKTLEGKTIVVGITGSIAAVETIKLIRQLKRKGANVHATMSSAACNIIHPNAVQYATRNKVITELTGLVEHVALLGTEGCADLLLIAPCTANTIGKIANGIDDTPVTTYAMTALGSDKPVVIAPAMHESMLSQDAVKRNMNELCSHVTFVQPRIDEQRAKLAGEEEIVLVIERILSKGDLEGKRVLVTSGPTAESLDPIRILTTRSSGRTGKAIAYEAFRRHADVTIVHNDNAHSVNQVHVESAAQMSAAVLEELKKGYDIFINTAALSDYTVDRQKQKIKSGQVLRLTLKHVPKLTDLVRAQYPGLFIVCFKAETHTDPSELIECARSIPVDLVVANDVTHGGMGTEDNEIYIVGSSVERYYGDKSFLATKVIDALVAQLQTT
ncbi:MAG: bifunctional phosphopantothenoylcysteine decarboxylase/phosphopantothenate--cysteine ligase CoaBC [Halobacteriota archaeon]